MEVEDGVEPSSTAATSTLSVPKEAYWCGAVITAVLVDGWFSADIVLPDGSDSWEDWFTWKDENIDWRRVAGGAAAAAKALAKQSKAQQQPPPPPKQWRTERQPTQKEKREEEALQNIKEAAERKRAERAVQRAVAMEARSSQKPQHPAPSFGDGASAAAEGSPSGAEQAGGGGESGGSPGSSSKRPRALASLDEYFSNGRIGLA